MCLIVSRPWLLKLVIDELTVIIFIHGSYPCTRYVRTVETAQS